MSRIGGTPSISGRHDQAGRHRGERSIVPLSVVTSRGLPPSRSVPMCPACVPRRTARWCWKVVTAGQQDALDKGTSSLIRHAQESA